VFKSADLLEACREDPNFIRNIIMGDKSWVCGYDPENKVLSSPQKARTSK